MNALITTALTLFFSLALGMSNMLDDSSEWDDAQRAADMRADAISMAQTEHRIEQAYLALCQQQHGPAVYVVQTLRGDFICRRATL